MTTAQAKKKIVEWQKKQLAEAYARFQDSMASIEHRRIAMMKEASEKQSAKQIADLKKKMGVRTKSYGKK